MAKYVEWVEPYHYVDDDKWDAHIMRICRVSVEDAIVFQKAAVKHDNKLRGRDFEYKTDADALDDFVVINWGTVIEEEEADD